MESKIQHSLTKYEVRDKDYMMASRAAWSKFYSCACQNRTAALLPIGLVDFKSSSAVMMIKQEMRPVEALEQVELSGGDRVTTEIFSNIPPLILCLFISNVHFKYLLQRLQHST